MQTEEPCHAGSDDERGDQNPQRRQRNRRPQRDSEHLFAGAQTAVEDDDRERDAAHELRGVNVVEPKTAGAVFTGEHAEQQKYEQQRRSQPCGDRTRHDAYDDQQRREQYQMIRILQRLALPSRSCRRRV